MKSLSSLALIAIAAACGSAADPEAGRQALLDADSAFERTTAERGADGWASWFAEDGAMLVPGREISGRDEIRTAMAGSFADTSFSIMWKPDRAAVARSGELGYTVGRYTIRSGAAAGRATRRGRYVTIWKKDAAGGWKVAVDLGVPDPAPAAEE